MIGLGKLEIDIYDFSKKIELHIGGKGIFEFFFFNQDGINLSVDFEPDMFLFFLFFRNPFKIFFQKYRNLIN